MHTMWIDETTDIEYEIEFIVGADFSSSGEMIPIIDEVVSMTPENGLPLNLNDTQISKWFHDNETSIFNACHERIADD